MPVTGDGNAAIGLGGPAGFGETEIPRSDDGALGVDLSVIFPSGINFFGVVQDASDVYVNTNGTVTFGAALGSYPTQEALANLPALIAPYWGDVDTRLDGEGEESGGIWFDLDTTTQTATFTWDDVGVYRRDATVTNTFQLQLIARGGGDLDIVFRYQSIEWTMGTAASDLGAIAGLASPAFGDPEWLFAAANDPGLVDLPTTLGNTGVAGLWVYEMRGGAVAGLIGGVNWTGTAAAESYTGTVWNDQLSAGAGNDTIFGGAGNDLILGDAGADRLFAEAGSDTVYGGDGGDTLSGGGGDDVIYGGATEADLRDNIYGGDGNDLLDGGYGNDEIRGDGGNDTITGGFGVDTVIGGAGDDQLTGQAWSDLIYGSDGDDFINGGFGYDRSMAARGRTGSFISACPITALTGSRTTALPKTTFCNSAGPPHLTSFR